MATKSECARNFADNVTDRYDRATKKISCKTHNSKVINDDNKVTYQLHGCPIVVADKKNRTLKLNSCGYHTQTTKSHMNEVLSKFTQEKVKQKKGEWFLDKKSFKDGMKVKY